MYVAVGVRGGRRRPANYVISESSTTIEAQRAFNPTPGGIEPLTPRIFVSVVASRCSFLPPSLPHARYSDLTGFDGLLTLRKLPPWSSRAPSIRVFWYDPSTAFRSLRFTRLTLLRQTSLQPEQAVNVLNDRVDLIRKINTDIADWLQVSIGCTPRLDAN